MTVFKFDYIGWQRFNRATEYNVDEQIDVEK